jgi:ribosomal protein S18 acetylase RimI-like enzyme
MSGAGTGEAFHLRAIADANFAFAFRTLAAHHPVAVAGSCRFGAAESIVTGVPSPFFNPIVVTGAGIEPGDLQAAIAWARARGVQPTLQVREDLAGRVEGVAADLGFVAEPWHWPGMALLHGEHAPETSELRTRIVPAAGADPWYEAAGYAMRRIIPPSFADDPSVVFVVGELDGRPVSHAIAVGDRQAVGIYSVGTSPEVRRRGYGRAITSAAITAGCAAFGSEVVILQSSELGLGVYRAMGFREITRYVIYEPPG